MTMVGKLFEEYVSNLYIHFYKNKPFEELLKNLERSHRRKRFVAMYLIQNKDIFWKYYNDKERLKLERIFNQIISALFHNKEDSRLKQHFVMTLELSPEMITEEVTSYEIKEIEKDLNAFSFSEVKKELKTNIDT